MSGLKLMTEQELDTLRTQSFGSTLERHQLIAAIDTARTERDEWKHKFEEQVWATSVGGRCAYCQEMKLTEEMPEHIASCEKHPMAALKAERDRMRKALEKALSAFTVSATPLPEDRAAVLEAVALIRAALDPDVEKRVGGQ